ncbi:ATP-binding protein [Acidobacteriota bacterium]
MRGSFDWQKRAVILFAVALIIISFFLAAFAIREAEREKLLKQSELEAEQIEIAEQIHDQIERLLSEAELETSSHVRNLLTELDIPFLPEPSKEILTEAAWIETIFVIDGEEQIHFLQENPLFELGQEDRDVQKSTFSDLRDPILAAAEAAEFKQRNYSAARSRYRQLFNLTNDRSIRANLLHRIGLCSMKSGRPLDAVPVYQEILKSYEKEISPDGTPLGILALYQLGRAYELAGRHESAMEISLTLYQDLLESRWNLPKARFQTYMDQVKDRLQSLEKATAAGLFDTWQSLSHTEEERFDRMKLLEAIVNNKEAILEKAVEGKLKPRDFARLGLSLSDQNHLLSLFAVSDTLILGMLFKSEHLIRSILPEALTAFSSPFPWIVGITDSDGNVLAGDITPSSATAAPLLNYSRTFDSEYLPWDIHVFMPSPNPAEKVFRKRRLLYILITLVVTAALAGGGIMAIRSTAKELRLARLKSEFVSTVSHEFRTPLTSIRYLAELLERGRVSDASQKHQYYQTITRESERLSRLIENTLDFSKIEAGMKEYEFTATDIAAMVKDTAAGFQNQASPKGFVIDCEINGEIPKTFVDRDAVRRALLNLLDNAVKYSGASRHIRVRMGADQRFIRIAVEDQGIGIKNEEQKRVFEKFYRAEIPHENQIKGSGIGLTLVAHTVQAHGGTVVLDSHPGKGTTVTLAFPLKPGNE